MKHIVGPGTIKATTTVVLSAVNNSSAVSRGYCEPNFAMRVKDLNTAEATGKAIYVESAQFELHFENVGAANYLYVIRKSQWRQKS